MYERRDNQLLQIFNQVFIDVRANLFINVIFVLNKIKKFKISGFF